jgi:hypothetical protein
MPSQSVAKRLGRKEKKEESLLGFFCAFMTSAATTSARLLVYKL